MLLDVHGHPPRDRSQLAALLAGLERFDCRLVLSELGSRTAGWLPEPSVEHWREGNALCAELVAAHPDQLLGYCYVNPAQVREALDEMERRLLGGAARFAGLKLWQALRCSDRRLDPLMDFCAAYDIPVLQHTWTHAGPDGPGTLGRPGESTPEDLAALARRHPRVRFFAGHTGGDFVWGAAALKHLDNVWLDLSGGEALTFLAEAALRAVGAGRIVFASDASGRSIPSQLAKLLTLPVSDADLERMLWQNAVDVLGDRLPPAWRMQYGTSECLASHRVPDPVVRRSAAAPAAPAAGRAGAATAQAVLSWAVSRPPRLPPVPPGGYLDASSYLGEWPGRRTSAAVLPDPRAQVDERVALMDRLGIRRAAVSRLEGAWLKDPSPVNAELHALVGARPERFFPVYTLNPTFPAWGEHLDRCREAYGLQTGRGALRLHPGHHGYRLDDPALDRCLDRLAGLDLPVVLTVQLEDPRIESAALRVADVAPDEVLALCARRVDVRWLITTATFAQALAVGTRVAPDARVWIDLSRVHGPVDSIPTLCAQVGSGRLLFGTNLPLHLAQSAVLELADARLTPEHDAAIRFGNAADALGMVASALGPPYADETRGG
jgi:predicted TIM-barrel fold metal-dependent hydrolase